MVRRLFSYWQTAKKETLIGGLMLILATFVDLMQPWPVKWLVDYVFGNHNAPGWLTVLWPALETKNMAGGIAAVCVSILALALIYRVGTTIGHFFLIRAGAHVVQQLRCHACEHLHGLSLAYHDHKKVGDSLYRVAYDSHAAQTLLNGAIVPTVNGIFVLLGATIIMLRINLLLTLVTMAVTPLFWVIIRGFSHKL